MQKIGDIKIRDIALSVFLFIFCFANLFYAWIPAMQYIDELVAVASLLFFLYAFLFHGKKMTRIDIWICALVVILCAIGVIGNFVEEYQTRWLVILLDVLSTFKFVFIYLGSEAISSRKQVSHDATRLFSGLCFIYCTVLFVLACINVFWDIGMTNEIRYGLRNFSFVYDIPGVVINDCCVIALVFLAKNDGKARNVWVVLMAAAVMISTLKSRGFVLAAACVIILLLKKVKWQRVDFFKISAIVLILVAIGFPQFRAYFLETTGPRALFLKNAFPLANRHILFGTGFATYGTGAAAHYYSPLYYELGFSSMYGMGPKDHMFLNDTFWPAALGQFGYLGLLCYFLLMVLLSVSVIKKNRSIRYCVFFLLLNMWLSSIQSAFPTSSAFASELFLVLLIGNHERETDDC